ncbi:unnamed protein product [Discosporangium mesarthrocarpum]
MCYMEGCDQPVRKLQRGRVSKYCQAHHHLETRARNKCCKEPGCSKNPHYGVSREIDPKSKAEYCSGHKKDGMINIHGRKCKHRGCMKQPRFDYQQGKGKFCADHRESGMLDVLYKPCAAEGCMKHPHFGHEEGGPRFCAKHRTDDMVDVKHPRCHTRGCPELRMVREDGHRAQLCAFHESVRSRTLYPRGREGRSQAWSRAKEGKVTRALPSLQHQISRRQEATGTAANSMRAVSSVSSVSSVPSVSPRMRHGNRKRKAPQWLEESKAEEGDTEVAPALVPSFKPDLQRQHGSLDMGKTRAVCTNSRYEIGKDHPSGNEDSTGSDSDSDGDCDSASLAAGDSTFLARWDQLTQFSSGGGHDGEGKKRKCSVGIAFDELLEAGLPSDTNISMEYKDNTPLAHMPPFGSQPKRTERHDVGIEGNTDTTHANTYVDLTATAAQQWSFDQIEGLEASMTESSQALLTPFSEREEKSYSNRNGPSPVAAGNHEPSWAPRAHFPSTFSTCNDGDQPCLDGDLPDACGLGTGTWSGVTASCGGVRVKGEENDLTVVPSAATSASLQGQQPQAQPANIPSNLQPLQGQGWGLAQGQWLGRGGAVREPSNIEGGLEFPAAEVPLLSSSSMSYSVSLMPKTVPQPFKMQMQSPSSGIAPSLPSSCYPVTSVRSFDQGPAVSMAASAAVAASSAAWASPSSLCTSFSSPLATDSGGFTAQGLASSADVVKATTGRVHGIGNTERHRGNPLTTLPCWDEEPDLVDANLAWMLKEEGGTCLGLQ